MGDVLGKTYVLPAQFLCFMKPAVVILDFITVSAAKNPQISPRSEECFGKVRHFAGHLELCDCWPEGLYVMLQMSILSSSC